MPPQFYLLSTLADILKGPNSTPAQFEKVQTLSRGLFGKMVFTPQPLSEDRKGRLVLTFEGDETRGGSKGRLHRVLATKTKDGDTSEMLLIRNFDIFSEMEDLQASPKL